MVTRHLTTEDIRRQREARAVGVNDLVGRRKQAGRATARRIQHFHRKRHAHKRRVVAEKRAHVAALLDERRKSEALDLYEKKKRQQPLREKTPGWHTKPVAALHQASVCVEDAPAR